MFICEKCVEKLRPGHFTVHFLRSFGRCEHCKAHNFCIDCKCPLRIKEDQ